MKFAGAALVPVVLCAQSVHESGGAFHVRGQCTAETVQTLSLPCTQDDPCPLYLELASVEAAANRIVLTGNIHTGAATIESVLLISDDAGKSWTEAATRIPLGVLDRIQFFDVEAGWISGHALQGVARDPFLLRTTDGGKTWRKRDLSSERRTGVIEEFWFDSREHGLLSVDRIHAGDDNFRYELWESMTGGESWSIRQVHSEPLTVKKPAITSNWRIRPDPAADVNRIEKAEGAAWTPLAAFSLSAGSCAPAEAEPPERPPPMSTEPPPAPPESAPSAPRDPPSLRRP